ncbi:PREDICTED: uncharacterized protein LOC108564540 [Nicrophorus vespilloides]|uniref:Uncharacterized protein LOC108564540 n=1 Tax=Nicrophorus vespilloides TaxID=110193 RepID=A0ABM1MX37_NICVS|nr:PREDICTED: uncharacterized protein LOC108564540 [Nicrophorus vespilloides]
MSVRFLCLFVLALAMRASADGLENAGVRIAMRVYDECSKSEGFSPCLKKKAITFLGRLGRMDKLTLGDGFNVVKAEDAPISENLISEEELEKTLPRASDSALDSILMDKISNFIGSRTIQITMPKFSASDLSFEEGRGKKMKGMMGGMMMGIAAKMAALIPVAIAGLFLLAGKALITAKIALLLSGIIALKKLLASKHSGGGGGGGHSGGHGGWSSGGSGGGWDKRSFDESQQLAYKAYIPQ